MRHKSNKWRSLEQLLLFAPVGTKRALNAVMVQLLIKLVAPVHDAKDFVQALRIVLRPAQQARGCRCAQIHQCVDDDRKLEYVEEWEDGDELRGQFGSERFVRLFELLETSAQRPVVEFRVISETHGLEYFVPAVPGGSSSSVA